MPFLLSLQKFHEKKKKGMGEGRWERQRGGWTQSKICVTWYIQIREDYLYCLIFTCQGLPSLSWQKRWRPAPETLGQMSFSSLPPGRRVLSILTAKNQVSGLSLHHFPHKSHTHINTPGYKLVAIPTKRFQPRDELAYPLQAHCRKTPRRVQT